METPYTIKTGDFRLLVTPSLELDWNDNINLASSGPQSDFILRPMLGLNAAYPLTYRNVLRLNTAFGYDIYLEHPSTAASRVLSGSQLSFDTYVKDFRINVHDRFQYTQDSAGQAAVAGDRQLWRPGQLRGSLGDVGPGGCRPDPGLRSRELRLVHLPIRLPEPRLRTAGFAGGLSLPSGVHGGSGGQREFHRL